jgi:predicted nucleic acid-binding protein
MSRIFVDTNILVYSFDVADPKRQKQAQRVLGVLRERGDAGISAQTLAEFAAVALRRLDPPLTSRAVLDALAGFVSIFEVVDVSPLVVQEAVRGVRDHHLSYYDAQIWAAARWSQASVLLSEDFASGQNLEGVRFVNPFAADFDLEVWRIVN